MMCKPLYTNEIGYIASVGDTFVYAGKGFDGKSFAEFSFTPEAFMKFDQFEHVTEEPGGSISTFVADCICETDDDRIGIIGLDQAFVMDIVNKLRHGE